MGQKVSPIGLRVGIIRDRESGRCADKDYTDLLLEDVEIREFLFAECENVPASKVEIERSRNRVEIMIRIARPGVIIETGGENVEMLKKKAEKLTGGRDIYLKVLEIANPDLDAKLATCSIASQPKQHASLHTAQKKTTQRTMCAGAKGIKTAVSGRLGGANMTRIEGYNEGVVPLHTLRIDIDYAWEEILTIYGCLGVKVWVYRGEVLPGQVVQEPEVSRNSMSDRHRNRYGNCGGNRNNSQRSSNNRNFIGGNVPREAEGGK